MWAPVIEKLSETFTCLNIDLPGHGESLDAGTYGLEWVVRAVHEVIEQQRMERPIIVGHSAGAILAAFYAGTFPTAAVVTSDQALRSVAFMESIRGVQEQLRGPAFLGIWRSIETRFGIELIPESRRHLVQGATPPRQDVVLGYWREILDTPPTELQDRFIEVLRRIDAPFTSIFGEEVELDYRTWFSGIVPQGEIDVYPNCGHFPHLVDPDRFADQIRAVAGRLRR
jgi:pimeloyl-ACP methyl ester carboxylesterase